MTFSRYEAHESKFALVVSLLNIYLFVLLGSLEKKKTLKKEKRKYSNKYREEGRMKNGKRVMEARKMPGKKRILVSLSEEQIRGNEDLNELKRKNEKDLERNADSRQDSSFV